MPCYNRAAFLPDAFAAVTSQVYPDWELIVVDDGSTDDSARVIRELAAQTQRPVRYLRQDNQGAYAARGAGLAEARGEYIAFYDSDDRWLPHHLSDCVAVLAADASVDWVYGSLRRVDARTGAVVEPDAFRVHGKPRPFMALESRPVGKARAIADPRALLCAISQGGLRCGLQVSVIRRKVFERVFFRTDVRNGEDRYFALRALKLGCVFAYLDDIHLEYRLHGEHSSAAGGGADPLKRLAIGNQLVDGWMDFEARMHPTPAERRAMRHELARELFWVHGVSILWPLGRRREALDAMRRGLANWRWSLSMWTTYLRARLWGRV